MTKLVMAFAFFMSSLTYESQVISTKDGLQSSWNVSISVSNQAFANMADAQLVNAF